MRMYWTSQIYRACIQSYAEARLLTGTCAGCVFFTWIWCCCHTRRIANAAKCLPLRVKLSSRLWSRRTVKWLACMLIAFLDAVAFLFIGQLVALLPYCSSLLYAFLDVHIGQVLGLRHKSVVQWLRAFVQCGRSAQSRITSIFEEGSRLLKACLFCRLRIRNWFFQDVIQQMLVINERTQ